MTKEESLGINNLHRFSKAYLYTDPAESRELLLYVISISNVCAEYTNSLLKQIADELYISELKSMIRQLAEIEAQAANLLEDDEYYPNSSSRRRFLPVTEPAFPHPTQKTSLFASAMIKILIPQIIEITRVSNKYSHAELSARAIAENMLELLENMLLRQRTYL